MARLTLAILAAGWAALCAGAAPPPGTGFEVVRYRLALTPDIATKAVAGRERIVLRATVAGLRSLTFSPSALTIDTARLDGKPVGIRRDTDRLGFDLPKPLARGRAVTLELTYHGRPARGLAGGGSTLYTSYFACDWMVCVQDAFGDKAAVSIDLHVPAGMTTVSVGRLVTRRRQPDGTELHRWRAPRPYPADLYGFAVGHFSQAKERAGSHTLTYLSDVADAAELGRRFADTNAMAAFLAEKVGVPLPTREYRQLLVAGDEAQEAATYSVLGVDAVPARPGDPEEDWAVVHELAHQWWGNLVTCADLREFWLNEGITTFMTAAWKEHRYGRAAYDAELAGARRRLAGAREKGYDKPLAWGGRWPDLGTRRAVQYGKGALFMAELRTALGEQAFWSGLRRYTRAHAGGTVTSTDLERAMAAASGQDVHALFDAWVFGEGAPRDPR